MNFAHHVPAEQQFITHTLMNWIVVALLGLALFGVVAMIYHKQQQYNDEEGNQMITIYTTPTCAFCHAAKEYFKSKDVKYKEKDLTEDQDAAQWVLNKTGQLAVPVIDINDTIIVGFNRPAIDDALSKK